MALNVLPASAAIPRAQRQTPLGNDVSRKMCTVSRLETMFSDRSSIASQSETLFGTSLRVCTVLQFCLPQPGRGPRACWRVLGFHAGPRPLAVRAFGPARAAGRSALARPRLGWPSNAAFQTRIATLLSHSTANVVLY